MKKGNAFSLVSAAAVASVVFVLSSCGGDKNKAAMMMQQQVPSIAVMTVHQGTADLESAYPATIKGKKDVDIRPQVTGFITKVCVDEGQQVAAGQTLFVLDQVQFEAAVRQAEASVAVAREAYNSQKITAQNKQKLFAKNIISEYENQLAQNSLASARAQLAQAEAALVNARKNLSYTVVKAPCAGFVGSIPNREGSLASPSSATPLTTISDISQVYAYISFNEKQILEMTDSGRVSLAKAIHNLPPVRLKLSDGSIYPFSGKVSTVTGLIDNMTGSASARVLFPNNNGMLRSGSTGSILIPIHQSGVISIPQNATTEIQDMRYAYVLGDSNKVASRPIKVMANNDGINFFVTSGLKDGERIAIEGVGVTVRDGSVIKPVAASQKAAAAVPASAKK